MKKIILLTATVLSVVLSQAQTARKVKVNISDDGKASMEVFLPERPTGRAVVGCPGGGYRTLSMQNEGTDWVDYFNRQGIVYGVLKYRMPNGDRTLPMSDAEKAVRTMRDSAAVWSINPFDVGIMGFSAGGHLASTTATHAPFESRPNFQILFYPVITMDERNTHKGSMNNFLGEGRNDKQLVQQFSNERAVRRHLTPPAIILTASDDRTVNPVNNGVAYYSAMRRNGNDCALYVYPSGGHGFGFRSNYLYHAQMVLDLTTWLNSLKAPRQDAVRVACIGNSITDGYGIDMATRNGYPAQLQQLLGSGYQVRNFGVSSRTMLNKGDYPYMNELAWRDALAFEPDVVIIKLGTNDSKPENWRYGAEFEKDLRQMIAALRANKRKPQIYLCTPIPAFKPTWNISDSVIVSRIIPIQRKVAKDCKLKLIDLHTLFAQDGDKMLSDGIHPDAKGARRMAELIAEELKK